MDIFLKKAFIDYKSRKFILICSHLKILAKKMQIKRIINELFVDKYEYLYK